MTDHTPFWDQLHDILQDELTVLRSLLGKISEIERAHQQNVLAPPPQDLEEAWAALKKVQGRRFDKTKAVTECSDLSLQDDYFSKWLKRAEDECEAASLWEQICTLTEKIGDQQELNAYLPLQARAEVLPVKVKQKIDTIDKL